MARVRRSTVVDAPLEAVWGVLRDFNGHAVWHPAVAESVIEDGRRPDQVGSVRCFSLVDGGGVLREQLLALSDRTYSFTYCILEAPLALYDYVAHVRLRPVTDGRRTLWEWWSDFEPPAAEAAALIRLVGEDIYQAGFAGLRRHLGLAERRAGTATARGPADVAEPRARPTIAARPAAPPATAAPVPATAVVLGGHGGVEVLRLEERLVPPPGPGQVRLAQTAIGVNFIDIYCRTGFFGLVAAGGVLGMEAAGVVTDVGPGVHGVSPGDRIGYACAPPGAYCSHRTMDARLLVPLPAEIDDVTAAAVLLKGITAAFLLHEVHPVQKGESVLVHAAAGGVGSLLCQWLREKGATVLGTVGSADKARVARSNGCAFPIVYTREDFAEAAMEITEGRGCDVVFDAVGRDSFAKSYEALAIRGHLVSYGQASGPIAPVDIGAFAEKSATVSRPNYVHYTSTPAQVRRLADMVFDAVVRGILRVEVGATLPLREAAEAHRRLESRQTTGSLVLTV